MKIRMKITISGTFHNIGGGVQRGDVVDVDEANAIRYCKLGYAEPVEERIEERAVVVPQVEERKQPDPEPEPEPEAPVAETVTSAADDIKAEFPKPQRRPGRQTGKSID